MNSCSSAVSSGVSRWETAGDRDQVGPCAQASQHIGPPVGPSLTTCPPTSQSSWVHTWRIRSRRDETRTRTWLLPAPFWLSFLASTVVDRFSESWTAPPFGSMDSTCVGHRTFVAARVSSVTSSRIGFHAVRCTCIFRCSFSARDVGSSCVVGGTSRHARFRSPFSRVFFFFFRLLSPVSSSFRLSALSFFLSSL